MEIYNKFIINNHNKASEFFYDYGIPERSLIDWCGGLLHDNDNFVDIGSHIGTYSIKLAHCCAKVYAFEASKQTYNQMCGSIALHEIRNIDTFNVALSNTNSENEVLWHVSIDGGGNSLIKPEENLIIKNEFVKVAQLDDYNLTNVTLIKIDIEGNELNCLKGATETIKTNRPKILFESNKDDNNRKELFDFLKSLNYQINNINGYCNMFIAYPQRS